MSNAVKSSREELKDHEVAVESSGKEATDGTGEDSIRGVVRGQGSCSGKPERMHGLITRHKPDQTQCR